MTETTNDTANPSLMAHVSIGSNDFDKAVEFYDKVLGVFGAHRIVDLPGAVAWGKQFPEFWVQRPIDGGKAQTANGIHFAFLAASTDEVDKFHAAGLAAGAVDDGQPGPRTEYTEAYYGAFLRDLEGHKIEAMYWDFSKAPVSAA